MQVLQPVDVECVCERDYVEQLKKKSFAPVVEKYIQAEASPAVVQAEYTRSAWCQGFFA
jgi:hypothetical protein